jgi:hypothetical protein
MELFRYLMLLISVAWLGLLAVTFWDHPPPGRNIGLILLIVASLVANIVYVWRSQPRTTGRPSDRIGRIVSLWLDAKETELRNRAKGKD